ncbi:MAG: DEAD/DEAH box helicase family protein, partial [archaeon]|nr:DEAD/DEAH box helicase family protein [archaeon]
MVEEWINESATRKVIDKQLKNSGWIEKYIKEEVNSVKSDFVSKNYILRGKKEEIEKEKDRFIDYLLLAENDSPLAIIETKRFSKDPEKGRIQARTYAKDIELQTHEKIPIFLTNSEKWLFIDQKGIERKISGSFTQEDLARKKELFKNEKDLTKISINNKIIDRPKLVLNLKILAEYLEAGNRTALIQMATGTGKTRLAMALIDVLDKGNRIRNVLFLVDRVALANQASSDGFKKFFREPVHEINIKGFSKNARFYTTTIQTLMEKKNGKEFFRQFSPGFFDLIIFDEAHRSIYDKNNLIAQYFDTIKIGLTATPRDGESKNTYELFECKDNKPTVEYSYDEAVNDQVLVPYNAQSIQTEILSLGIKGKELSPDLKDQLRQQEADPEHFEASGRQFGYVFMDDKTNELIITEFLKRCYRSDDNLPAKTIFFCASQKHATHVKKIFNKIAPNLSNQVQVIVSEYYRAEDEVQRFKLDSEPRIALSVGMLDTGIDVPEVCNLVFVKPVISSIRFWQMLGRGTRNFDACRHPEWLPNREKKDFLVLDFDIGGHSNIEYHKLKQSKQPKTQESPAVKIFTNRVKLLKEKLDEPQKQLIVKKILTDLKSLDQDSFIVREKWKTIRKLQKRFDLENYVNELNNEIAPLFILIQGQSSEIYGFILQVERLFGYILKKDFEKI